VARLHPAIKGVMGAQPTGASIVSFNSAAFASYGAEQGLNSPVSETVAEAYVDALNTMLRRGSGHTLPVGDVTAVFWCDASGVGEASAAAAETTFLNMMDCVARTKANDGTEVAKLRDDVARLAAGENLASVNPDVNPATRTYILGLSANVSRLYPRFWHRDTFGAIQANVARHWEDMRILPPPTRAGQTIPVWRLVRETAPQGKADRVAPSLAGDLMRAVLTGGRYPRTLLASVVARVQADRDVNGVKAAICRACLQRDYRKGYEREGVPVALDRNDPNPAYHLGRLFALMEQAQQRALGNKINASIRDKFFTAASTMPARVFPVLFNRLQKHVSKIRKDRTGGVRAADRIDGEIAQVLEAVGPAMPRTLGIEDQGRFAIGFYHQRGASVGKNGAAGTGGPDEPPTDASGPPGTDTDTDTQTEHTET
jgi:CRISPR-associated protein Csd1